MKRLALGLAASLALIGAAAAQTGSANRAAASGDNNQAVATTNANAAQPAHGANSFTENQARARIQDNGFANVTDLRKGDDGVWRGRAQKGGQTVSVWLDYKGNVGAQQP